MTKAPEWFGRVPFEPSEKKPAVLHKETMRTFIYPLTGLQNSDLNWLIASTDKLFCAIYQVPPGGTFDPPDVHAGDEPYYILQGILTMLNPETGQVARVSRGESLLIPKGSWHKGYNFENNILRILVMIAPKIWPEEGAPDSFPGEIHLYKASGRTVTCEDTPDRRTAQLGQFPVPGPAARKAKRLIHIPDNEKLVLIHGQKSPAMLRFFVSNDVCHMGEITIPTGEGARATEQDRHAGDAAIYVELGPIVFFLPETSETFEVKEGDAMFLPEGTPYQCVNFTGNAVRGIFMIAPGI